MNFRFLNQPELHRRHRAFRFGNEVDVFDGAFIESNRPVRIIMTDWCCDIEAVRQFYIDCNIRKDSIYIIAEKVELFNLPMQGLTEKFQLLGLPILSTVYAYKSGPDKHELSDPLDLFALIKSLLCLFLLISYAE